MPVSTEVEQIDPMDIDSVKGDNDRTEIKKGKGEPEEEQFEIVNHEVIASTIDTQEANKSDVSTTTQGQETDPKSEIDKQEGVSKPAPQTSQHFDSQSSQEQSDQFGNNHSKQLEMLTSEVIKLKSDFHRQSPNPNGRTQTEEVIEMVLNEKNKQQQQLIAMANSRAEMETQIHDLLKTRDQWEKHVSQVEIVYKTLKANYDELHTKYQMAINHIHSKKMDRDETELNLRSEITAAQGQFRKEKERAQKLMKTMADMQSADPLKLDNAYIKSAVDGLRYDIKNWARNQRLVPSLPSPGIWQAVAGLREKGPNYDFLKSITPLYHEYTGSHHDFKLLLQAYIWQQIVDLLFVEDMWAGGRRPLSDTEQEYKLIQAFRIAKSRLEPDDKSTPEYKSLFHEWRSNSARILDQKLSPERRKHSIQTITQMIVGPLLAAAAPEKQDLDLEDLDSIVESAMRLGCSIAQQRASFVFEFVPFAAHGKSEFRSQIMAETSSPEPFDGRTHFRAVMLTLAPRLYKYGTSEGTNFDNCVPLNDFDVETKVLPKRYARSMGMGG